MFAAGATVMAADGSGVSVEPLDPGLEALLVRSAEQVGTPCYVYRPAGVVARIERLRRAFAGTVSVGYAVKANPNLGLLRRLAPYLDRVDVSSVGELELALAAGFEPTAVGFTGPAKRDEEIAAAVAQGCGVVCESASDLARLESTAAAANTVAPALVRVNPRRIPDVFDLPMAGMPSPFGIDEEDLDPVLAGLDRLPHTRFEGFHAYLGSNCRDAAGVATGVALCCELFARVAAHHALTPRTLIIGPGFGIRYHPGEGELDVDMVATQLEDTIARHRTAGPLAQAEMVLELGRWLVGPEGWLVTRVIGCKRSRGVEIRMLDAGFHTHLAAAGMLGGVLRRPWRFHALTGRPTGGTVPVMLTGPLCTSLDVMAPRIELPSIGIGDLLAIESAGAYGLSASPTRFISHPPPREVLWVDGRALDVTGDDDGRRGGV